ncbi:17370_t:CDS:2 [Acaulospora morrowiae]|uniref:17370_t:CDS:1 n=1 Tax=Acaulospora morrowiae TaxID=94023 RepID=A0A9N8YYF5_9GLOM|nr:17370_t:CDS:2 [Acaulospora morrowiae]
MDLLIVVSHSELLKPCSPNTKSKNLMGFGSYLRQNQVLFMLMSVGTATISTSAGRRIHAAAFIPSKKIGELPFTMNATLLQVIKYCGEKLEAYQRCVENHPSYWQSACLEQKRELTKCSEENVPEIKMVKERCNNAIIAFDECLARNESDPEVCRDKLKALYECTEANAGLSVGNNVGGSGKKDNSIQ